jgi:hypothetical protein
MVDHLPLMAPGGNPSITSKLNPFSERPITRRAFMRLLAAAGVLASSLPDASKAAQHNPSVVLTDSAILTILGVVQPASLDTLLEFVQFAIPEVGANADSAYLLAALGRHLKAERIFRVKLGPPSFIFAHSGR